MKTPPRIPWFLMPARSGAVLSPYPVSWMRHRAHLEALTFLRTIGDRVWLGLLVNELNHAPGQQDDTYPFVLSGKWFASSGASIAIPASWPHPGNYSGSPFLSLRSASPRAFTSPRGLYHSDAVEASQKLSFPSSEVSKSHGNGQENAPTVPPMIAARGVKNQIVRIAPPSVNPSGSTNQKTIATAVIAHAMSQRERPVLMEKRYHMAPVSVKSAEPEICGKRQAFLMQTY
jgi:hypothetical protein